MSEQYLWLPGAFPSTNELLSRQRADGWYARDRADRPRGQRRAPAQSAAQDIRRIRDAANMHARSARLRPVIRAHLRFLLIGRSKYDPSAWTLAAKPIEDGLVDAKVLGSDRFNVWEIGGRCTRGEVDALFELARAGVVWNQRRAPVGMLVRITDLGPA